MQAELIDRELIRRLADARPEDGRVLSVYLNLDPQEFATPAARSSAIRSVVDEADRKARDDKQLRAAVERVRDFLQSTDFRGAHALAVFSDSADGLFESIRLPRPVQNEVVVDSTPYVEPLAELTSDGDWLVLLASRRVARFLRGSEEGFEELGRIETDTHGQHRQGGWSHPRYERSVDNEAMHHLRRAAQELDRRLRRGQFKHVLLGAPEETYAALERELSHTARERVRGRVAVDVEASAPEVVLEAARPLIAAFEQQRQSQLLERLHERLGGAGHAAAGIADVLETLSERRVETLLLDERFAGAGVRCTRCGWLGPADAAGACPADGAQLERLDDLREAAVESAVRQDANVVVLHDRAELGPHGGIAALLRF